MLVENFAAALIDSPNKDGQFIALVEKWDLDEILEKEGRNGNYSLKESNNFSLDYYAYTFIHVLWSSCNRADNLIVIKNGYSSFSHTDPGPYYAFRGNLDLLILNSILDEDHKLLSTVPDFRIRAMELDRMTKIDFLTPRNVFYLIARNSQNYINIKWAPYGLGKGELKPAAVLQAPEGFIDELKKLSAIFCSEQLDPFAALESVKTLLPSIQTDLGKQIAAKVLDLLEKKIIETEFPKGDSKN